MLMIFLYIFFLFTFLKQNSRPRAEVHVTKPVDVKLMRVMHRMIERVLVHGPLFEAMIMDRELHNPTFQFLFDYTVSLVK